MSAAHIGMLLAAVTVLVTCSSDPAPAADDPPATADVAKEQAAARTPAPTEEPAVDPAEVGANELGEIPVLRYHRVFKGASATTRHHAPAVPNGAAVPV